MGRQATATAQPELPTFHVDKLPKITAQQFAFVQAFIAGQNPSEAHKTAYPKSAKWDKVVLSVNAWELLQHPSIKIWIQAAREHALFGVCSSADEYKRQLYELTQMSVSAGTMGAAVKAQELIGKVDGHFEDRLRIIPDALDISALCRAIETLLGPAQARIAAQKLGIGDYNALEHDPGDDTDASS